MANMQRFLFLQHSDQSNIPNWGWVDALDAITSLSTLPASSSSQQQHHLLGALYAFLLECHEWLSVNSSYAPICHDLMDTQGVISSVCSICRRYLQLLHQEQDGGQISKESAACVFAAAHAVRYVVLLIKIRGEGAATVTSTSAMRLKMARAVTETGLLDALCRASTDIQHTLQQHTAVSRHSCLVCGHLLDLWHIIAGAWPGKLLLGNTIARSVPCISGLAVAVLAWVPYSAANTETSQGGAASSISVSEGHNIPANSNSSSRRNAKKDKDSRRGSKKKSNSTEPLLCAALRVHEATQQGPHSNSSKQARELAVDAALLVANRYMTEVIMSDLDTDSANLRQIQSSAAVQQLLMIAFGVWVTILHKQQEGHSPTVKLSRGCKKKQLQQLVVPACHKQLLLGCGVIEEDMTTLDPAKLMPPDMALRWVADAVVQVCKHCGGVASSSRGSCGSSDVLHDHQQQQQLQLQQQEADGILTVPFLSTVLEAAALLPAEQQLSVLLAVCSLYGVLSLEQLCEASTGLLQTAMQLLAPMLQQAISDANSSSSNSAGEDSNLEGSSDSNLAEFIAAAGAVLRTVLFQADDELRLNGYQQQPADWSAAAAAAARSVGYCRPPAQQHMVSCSRSGFGQLISAVASVFQQMKAVEVSAVDKASASKQQQQQQIGLFHSLLKGIHVVYPEGALQLPQTLHLVQTVHTAICDALLCLSQLRQADAVAKRAVDWMHLRGKALYVSGKAISFAVQGQQPGQQQRIQAAAAAWLLMTFLYEVAAIYQGLSTVQLFRVPVQADHPSGAPDVTTAMSATAFGDIAIQQLNGLVQGLLLTVDAAAGSLEGFVDNGGSSSRNACTLADCSSSNSASSSSGLVNQTTNDALQRIDQMLLRLAPVADSFQQQQEQAAGLHTQQPLQDLLPEQLLQQVFNLNLAQQLQQFGAAVCAALPVSCCCNNPGCVNLSKVSEQSLVKGKACVCAKCEIARYCGKECQVEHWPAHKAVCKRIKKAMAAAAAAAAAGC